MADASGTDRPRPASEHRAEGLFRGDGIEFKAEAMPAAGEPIVEKTVNSAFIGTKLETMLRAQGANAIVIAGLTTDHCCSTTARMARQPRVPYDSRVRCDSDFRARDAG